MARDWDGGTYDRISDPMLRMGAIVLDRLPLDGDERVLDAGCGSGRVTELLAERLPRGTVVALDGSASMVAQARERLARFGERIETVVADLGAPLPASVGTVDAILSTATFHWVPDHDALFRHLAAVLRPGGRLVAQCGGAGNIARVHAVVEALGGPPHPTTFATPEATTARLEAAGFRDIRCWLQPEPVVLEPGEAFATYLRTIVLSGHLPQLPEAEREPFVRAVAERLGEPRLDYVRLNILATRA